VFYNMTLFFSLISLYSERRKTMAQRTIHYLFGELISNQVEIHNKKRFLLGSILPDAIEACNRNTSHFKVKTDTRKYFDFDAFRIKYSDLINQDDLYLGYYMHLVEDAFYRVFFYNPRFSMPRSKEEVPLLHQDYHILNAYIVQKYQIQNILDFTEPIKDTSLFDLTTFFVDEFLAELSHDFTEQIQGHTTFITESMLDQFVAHFIPLAIKEVKSIRNGAPGLKATDFTWPVKR